MPHERPRRLAHPSSPSFHTCPLQHKQKRRNDEFCEQRRTGVHLAEGAAKDTRYVHATVLPSLVTFPSRNSAIVRAVFHHRCGLVQPGELVCAMTAGLALFIVHPPARWRARTAESSTFHNGLPRCWKTRCWRPRSRRPTLLSTSKMSRKTRYWRTRPWKPTSLHQRQATAGALRQEKVRDDSGQATE